MCVHLCVHVGIGYVCALTCTCACVCMWVWAMHVHVSVHVGVGYVCASVCVHVGVGSACAHVHMCTCVCMHTCVHVWNRQGGEERSVYIPSQPGLSEHHPSSSRGKEDQSQTCKVSTAAQENKTPTICFLTPFGEELTPPKRTRTVFIFLHRHWDTWGEPFSTAFRW